MLPNEDPGWKQNVFWALVPGALPKRVKPSAGEPGHLLAMLRGITLTFVFGMVLIGLVVVVLIVAGIFSDPWTLNVGVLAMAAVCVASLVASEMIGRRALDCSSDETLLATFHERFFARIAIVQAASLLGFCLFLVGHPALFVLGFGTTMFGLWRIAPTTARIDLEDDKLRSVGCSRSFTSALRALDEKARAPGTKTTAGRPRSPAQSRRTTAGEGGSSRVQSGRTVVAGTDGPPRLQLGRSVKAILVFSLAGFVMANIRSWIETPDPNPNEELCVSLAAELLDFFENAQPAAAFQTGYDNDELKRATELVRDGYEEPSFCDALIFEAGVAATVPSGAVEIPAEDMPELLRVVGDDKSDLHSFYRIDQGETTILLRFTESGNALRYAAAYGTDCESIYWPAELYSWIVACYAEPLAD